MKKLHLALESLRVESFDTDVAEAPRGTVEAHLTNGAFTCAYHCTWADNVTCYESCNCSARCSANCSQLNSCAC